MIENFTEMMTRDATEQHRQEQMLEVYSVKETLAERGCPIDLKVINKALLIPEEPIRYPGTFLYPHPGANLMKNPFAKKAKAKKKKGRKKMIFHFKYILTRLTIVIYECPKGILNLTTRFRPGSWIKYRNRFRYSL